MNPSSDTLVARRNAVLRYILKRFTLDDVSRVIMLVREWTSNDIRYFDDVEAHYDDFRRNQTKVIDSASESELCEYEMLMRVLTGARLMNTDDMDTACSPCSGFCFDNEGHLIIFTKNDEDDVN
jgi:hypothetical protein